MPNCFSLNPLLSRSSCCRLSHLAPLSSAESRNRYKMMRFVRGMNEPMTDLSVSSTNVFLLNSRMTVPELRHELSYTAANQTPATPCGVSDSRWLLGSACWQLFQLQKAKSCILLLSHATGFLYSLRGKCFEELTLCQNRSLDRA